MDQELVSNDTEELQKKLSTHYYCHLLRRFSSWENNSPKIQCSLAHFIDCRMMSYICLPKLSEDQRVDCFVSSCLQRAKDYLGQWFWCEEVLLIQGHLWLLLLSSSFLSKRLLWGQLGGTVRLSVQLFFQLRS